MQYRCDQPWRREKRMNYCNQNTYLHKNRKHVLLTPNTVSLKNDNIYETLTVEEHFLLIDLDPSNPDSTQLSKIRLYHSTIPKVRLLKYHVQANSSNPKAIFFFQYVADIRVKGKERENNWHPQGSLEFFTVMSLDDLKELRDSELSVAEKDLTTIMGHEYFGRSNIIFHFDLEENGGSYVDYTYVLIADDYKNDDGTFWKGQRYKFKKASWEQETRIFTGEIH